MKYEELYRQGINLLQKAEIEEAVLDARLLLENICGTDRNYLLVHGMEDVTKQQEESYVNQIKLRSSHIPLQHIMGYQEFMGLRFKVTPDVLIPRQDTETLTEEVMRYLHDGMHVLDMCTGSGCILCSLLHYSNDCIGTGCDISEAALKVARENAENLNIQADFIQSNLFENITGKFEIIVSNPPYIPCRDIPSLMEEVREHDPLLALEGGADGLDFYREIAKQSPKYLHPGGMLLFEIGWNQAEDVSTIMKNAGFSDVRVCKDLAGLDRVVSGVYGG